MDLSGGSFEGRGIENEELGNEARMGAGDRVTIGMTGVVKNRLSVGPTAYSLGNG